MATETPKSQARCVAAVRHAWDAKAAFRDERMGDGNAFQLELIAPAVERLLDVRPGERILDVACGNGVSSRRRSRRSPPRTRDARTLSWSNVPDIPPVLAARFVPRRGG